VNIRGYFCSILSCFDLEGEMALRARLILADLHKKQGRQAEVEALLNELVALSDAVSKDQRAAKAGCKR
jgi:hypothetical protein